MHRAVPGLPRDRPVTKTACDEFGYQFLAAEEAVGVFFAEGVQPQVGTAPVERPGLERRADLRQQCADLLGGVASDDLVVADDIAADADMLGSDVYPDASDDERRIGKFRRLIIERTGGFGHCLRQ